MQALKVAIVVWVILGLGGTLYNEQALTVRNVLRGPFAIKKSVTINGLPALDSPRVSVGPTTRSARSVTVVEGPWARPLASATTYRIAA